MMLIPLEVQSVLTHGEKDARCTTRKLVKQLSHCTCQIGGIDRLSKDFKGIFFSLRAHNL